MDRCSECHEEWQQHAGLVERQQAEIIRLNKQLVAERSRSSDLAELAERLTARLGEAEPGPLPGEPPDAVYCEYSPALEMLSIKVIYRGRHEEVFAVPTEGGMNYGTYPCPFCGHRVKVPWVHPHSAADLGMPPLAPAPQPDPEPTFQELTTTYLCTGKIADKEAMVAAYVVPELPDPQEAVASDIATLLRPDPEADRALSTWACRRALYGYVATVVLVCWTVATLILMGAV